MRIVQRKLEYLLKCSCGTEIAYIPEEIGKQFRCPKCNAHLVLTETQDMYMLQMVNKNQNALVDCLGEGV